MRAAPGSPWGPSLSRFGLAIAACAAIASPCLGQVIDIADDGEATTYAEPQIFTADGATPIQARANPVRPADLSHLIADSARRHQVSAELITEVAWQESRFRQTAVSPRGAVGVMQLTDAAAREVGVDRFDLGQNISGGAGYLRRMLDRYRGDVRLALAAYNAGPGAVDRYGGVPPYRETQAYVASILGRLSLRGVVAPPPLAIGR